MARGGSRGRRTSYVRDNSGRFASTPGGGPPKRSTPASRRAARAKVTGGTLGARSSLRRSRTKLAAKNPADRSLRGSLSLRAQRGAVTRGANRLGKVRAASTVRMAGKGPAGVIRGGRKVAGRPVASAAPKDYRRGRSAAAGYKPKTDRTLASSQVGTRAKLSEFQRAEAQTAKQRFGVRSTAQRARMRAGSYDPAKQGGGRVTFRTRAEARKAYLKRAAATKSTASKSYNDGRYVGDGVKTGTKGSARIRTATVAQGNLLSGKADNVKVRKVRSLSGRSALGGAMRRGAAKSAKPVAAQPKLAAAKRIGSPRPSGTLAKPRNLKPGAIAARKAKAGASSARGARATTNYNRAQKAALEAQQRVNRRRSPKNLAALARADKSLKTAARAYRILVGLGGEKMAVARKPSPKGAGPRMKAARPAGTVAKPRGLKPDRWIKKERVIGKGEVWMGRWTPPSGGKPKRRKTSTGAAKPAKAKAPSAPKINGKEWTSLSRLRGAVPFDRGRGQTGYFIPGSSLTPAKRNKLGLGAFKSEVSGGNFIAQRHTQGSQEGWIISPRTPRGETPVQIQRSKSSRKPKTASDLLTQATRIESVGRRMSRAARTGARDRQIEARAVRAAKAARQRAFDMQKPPSKAELKRQGQRLNSPTTTGLNARLARDYAARGRR